MYLLVVIYLSWGFWYSSFGLYPLGRVISCAHLCIHWNNFEVLSAQYRDLQGHKSTHYEILVCFRQTMWFKQSLINQHPHQRRRWCKLVFLSKRIRSTNTACACESHVGQMQYFTLHYYINILYGTVLYSLLYAISPSLTLISYILRQKQSICNINKTSVSHRYLWEVDSLLEESPTQTVCCSVLFIHGGRT